MAGEGAPLAGLAGLALRSRWATVSSRGGRGITVADWSGTCLIQRGFALHKTQRSEVLQIKCGLRTFSNCCCERKMRVSRVRRHSDFPQTASQLPINHTIHPSALQSQRDQLAMVAQLGIAGLTEGVLDQESLFTNAQMHWTHARQWCGRGSSLTAGVSYTEAGLALGLPAPAGTGAGVAARVGAGEGVGPGQRSTC